MLGAWGAPIPAQGRQALPAPLGGLLSDQGWGSHLPVPDPSLPAPAKPKYNSANSGAVSQ